MYKSQLNIKYLPSLEATVLRLDWLREGEVTFPVHPDGQNIFLRNGEKHPQNCPWNCAWASTSQLRFIIPCLDRNISLACVLQLDYLIYRKAVDDLLD